jgi:hypothetical protein
MTMNTMKFKPLIILGAPRSGTNILRDVLTALPQFATWPCDEINYIWRYGNARHEDDELTQNQLSPRISSYIRRQFFRIARKYDAHQVVEKTCANTLRVAYVDAIFPEALYINIIRDGRSAVSSAMKRWRASLDLKYVAKKARYIPARDVPYYAYRYLSSHLYRFFFSREGRVSFWGPRFSDYERLVRDLSLLEICAVQWQRCINMSNDYLEEHVDPSRFYTIRYEDFVDNPQKEVAAMLDSFKITFDPDRLMQICSNVHKESLLKWKENLASAAQERLDSLLKKDLQRYGYIDG